MEERIKYLENELEKIKLRNRRVEASKAWETSPLRIVLISLLTYIVAAAFMLVIKANRPFLSALVPTLGFFLSTISIPFVRRWWIQIYLKTRS